MAVSHSESTPAQRASFGELVESAPAPKRRLLSIVVPLLNEEATLEQLYRELEAALASKGLEWEVVFVDDGSTDG